MLLCVSVWCSCLIVGCGSRVIVVIAVIGRCCVVLVDDCCVYVWLGFERWRCLLLFFVLLIVVTCLIRNCLCVVVVVC